MRDSDRRRFALRLHALATGLLLVPQATIASAADHECVWMLQPNTGLESLAAATGYARAGMYDESEQVLREVEEDEPTADGLAIIDMQRGINHYAIGDLQSARRHYQRALESDRPPTSRRGWIHYQLMRIDFEQGNFGAAAASGERARRDYLADDCTDKSDAALAAFDVDLAKYLSHADRDRALQYALGAVALAPEGTLSATDLAWVEQLKTGPAPAAIPPVKRRQRSAAPITRQEALRLLSWKTYYRELVRKPPSARSFPAASADDDFVWVTREVTTEPPSIDLPDMQMRKPALPESTVSVPPDTATP